MNCHVCKIIIPILLIFVALLYIGSRFLPPLAPDHLAIATGPTDGIYYQSALRYQTLLAKQHVSVDIIPTNGSLDALKLLKDKRVDVAFVQGGSTGTYASEPFTSLAALYNEPIWVFYPDSGKVLQRLSDLKGERIAVGAEGSGTKALAIQLLAANGVTAENSTFLSVGSDAGAAALREGRADALFSIIGTFAPLTKQLLLDPKIRLFDFTRAHAYTVRYPFLNAVTLDEGVMDLENNLPPQAEHLIAATATLVSRSDIHPDLVRLLLQAAKSVHGSAGIFRKAGEFPNTSGLEFPLNVNAEVYLRDGESWLEKIFPFWVASIVKRLMLLLIPVIALMIPIIKLLLPLISWRSRYKIYRWYKTLNKVEEEIQDYDEAKRRDAIASLETALQKIQKIDVPLSYRREYYDLLQHFELILGKLQG